MPVRRLILWTALALAGIGAVAALAFATSRLAARPVGLPSEALTTSARLAPARTVAPPPAERHRSPRARSHVAAHRRPRTPQARPASSPPPAVTPVPPAVRAPSSRARTPTLAPRTTKTTTTAKTTTPSAPVTGSGHAVPGGSSTDGQAGGHGSHGEGGGGSSSSADD